MKYSGFSPAGSMAVGVKSLTRPFRSIVYSMLTYTLPCNRINRRASASRLCSSGVNMPEPDCATQYFGRSTSSINGRSDASASCPPNRKTSQDSLIFRLLIRCMIGRDRRESWEVEHLPCCIGSNVMATVESYAGCLRQRKRFSRGEPAHVSSGGVAQVVEIRKRRSLQLGTNQDAAPASAEESTPCATLPPLHPHCRT